MENSVSRTGNWLCNTLPEKKNKPSVRWRVEYVSLNIFSRQQYQYNKNCGNLFSYHSISSELHASLIERLPNAFEASTIDFPLVCPCPRSTRKPRKYRISIFLLVAKKLEKKKDKQHNATSGTECIHEYLRGAFIQYKFIYMLYRREACCFCTSIKWLN